MRALLALSGFLAACDPPAPAKVTQSPTPALAVPALPPPGILRLTMTDRPADLESTFAPTSGLPRLFLKTEYSGPRARLGFEMEFWWKGRQDRQGKSHHAIDLPLSGGAAFGFAEDKDNDGNPILKLFYSLPGSGSGGNRSRLGGASDFKALPTLSSPLIILPAWPLEIADGKEAVFWAVLVNEPPGTPAGAPLEDRAKKAEAAWLFRMRTEAPEK